MEYSSTQHTARVLLLLSVLTTVAACAIPISVGGYQMSGQVVDKATGEPVDGMQVTAEVSYPSYFDVDPHALGVSITDAEGRYEIDTQRATIWAARRKNHPTLWFDRVGYCVTGSGGSYNLPENADERERILEDRVFEITPFYEGCVQGTFEVRP